MRKLPRCRRRGANRWVLRVRLRCRRFFNQHIDMLGLHGRQYQLMALAKSLYGREPALVRASKVDPLL